MLKIYHWPGAVQGYKSAGVWKRGVGETNTAGTAQVLAKNPVDAYNWYGRRFCAKRMNREQYVYKNTATATCATGQFACSECECRKSFPATTSPVVAARHANIGDCPISEIKMYLNSAAATEGVTPVANDGWSTAADFTGAAATL